MNTATSQEAPLAGEATPHPVQLSVWPRAPAQRVHVVARAIFLVALGVLGASSIYWLLYLVLPALVALLVIQKGGERALSQDGPKAVRVLRWLASAYAYLLLLTDVLPTSEVGPVNLRIELGNTPPPTPTSALLRLVYSLPALVLAAVLSALACPFWLVGAIWILTTERLPNVVRDFLTFTLRYQFRFAAYHLSLVDRYPSFEEAHARELRPDLASPR